ncbi:Ribosomal RNA small subunit methyltransferase I [Eubacterium callanderi]|uniref:16S rRNA (cytidine(1402)-2'-O)-methyltransferase n=1 Tax=Eubacterium callanderi TaxID=53442 RepID=UPI0029FF54BD|nr:16S rRNA (cytidine(1402)-2'-O)-methyltransferase [Eubacterium callanderi]WPK70152.1 Ribosomal RNA small subunit methyltransferase I [Eubacterium callanderi]WPK74450.1 Ribosomal RNA small subunit methyltransferase I [Eubacterium callanderi]
MPGKLYIVGTPIGNLEDITLRALRILKEVDVIAAEDTRHTVKLLNHFELKKHLLAYHQHNEQSGSEKLLELLAEGKNIALVSDAGMPVISDPGSVIVSRCNEAGIPVEVVPGPNAGLCALVLSGIDARAFTFMGFLGKQNKEIRGGIEKIAASENTVILYETPHRLVKTLEAMVQVIPDRKMSISREITKKYEETRIGTVQEHLDWYSENPPKGEFVLVIEGGDGLPSDSQDLTALSLDEHMAHYEDQGMGEKEAMKQVARDRGVSKRDIYNLIKR